MSTETQAKPSVQYVTRGGRHEFLAAEAETYQDLPDARIDGPGAFGIGRRKARLDGAVAVIGEGDGGLVAIVASRSPETAQRLETAAR